MSKDICEKFIDLVDSENVMTLSTSDSGSNWSTPVFYLYDKPNFYFLSSKDSKHVTQACLNPNISVSIFKNESSWEGIKGIQMEGVQEKVRKLGVALKIIKRYLARYPFTKELFNVEQLLKLSHKKIDLFVFKPTKILYTDNSIEFGFKKEIEIS